MVAQVTKSTGSRDEFGTYAEVELKTDEYTGVQARGVWVLTEATAFGETQAKRQKDRQLERTTEQNQSGSHTERDIGRSQKTKTSRVGEAMAVVTPKPSQSRRPSARLSAMGAASAKPRQK